MNIHFEYGPKEKAPLGELIEVCDVALSFIHERTQLFKLLRAYSTPSMAAEELPNDEGLGDIFKAAVDKGYALVTRVAGSDGNGAPVTGNEGI